MAERSVSVSYETRLWMNKSSPVFTRRLKRKHQGFGDTYLLYEVFVQIRGRQHYLWRAVDRDGMPSLDGASSMHACKRKETPTIGQSLPINPPVSGNEVCVGSNRSGRRSDF